MPHIPTYPSSSQPGLCTPEHLMKYMDPVAALVDEVINTGDPFWGPDPHGDDEKPVFVLSVAAPSNNRFLIMLSVDSDDAAEDPRIIALGEQVIRRIEEKFPELVEWVDWMLTPP